MSEYILVSSDIVSSDSIALTQQSHVQIPAGGPNQAFRPAFWDSKLYGEPFGNFHRFPTSAKGNGPRGTELPYQKRLPSAQLGDLARLEQTMRAVVNRRATVHEPDKVQLLKAFAKALGKRRAEVKDTVCSSSSEILHCPQQKKLLKLCIKGLFRSFAAAQYHTVVGERYALASQHSCVQVRLEQFQQAWRQFDVALSHVQAEGLFNKYGQVGFLLYQCSSEGPSDCA